MALDCSTRWLALSLMLGTVTGCSPSFGLAWTAASPGAADVDTSSAREYVGSVAGTSDWVAVTAQGGTAHGVLMGVGATPDLIRFTGSFDGKTLLAADADDHHRLGGSAGTDPTQPLSLSGSVTLADGSIGKWSASLVTPGTAAGLYEGDDGSNLLDLIVASDGTSRGAARAKDGDVTAALTVTAQPGTSRCARVTYTMPGEVARKTAMAALVNAGPGCALPTVAPSASPSPRAAGLTLYVDAGFGSDATNDGSENRPFKTLAKAIDLAGDNSHVVVKPGTYRENVRIEGRKSFWLEAKNPNSVTITGSDLYDGWQPDPGHPGAYTHPWTLKLGEAPSTTTLQPLGRRLEMLFLDGRRLTQVATAAELAPKTFMVDEAAGVIRMLPARYDPAHDTVEVSVRPVSSGYGATATHADDHLLVARNVDNLHLSGISFVQANSPLADGASVLLDACNDLVMQDCVVNDNNGIGLRLQGCNGFALTNVQCNDNGVEGLLAADCANGTGSTVEATANNWRGAQGGVFDGWVGGMTWRRSKNVTLDHVALHDNQAPGLDLEPADTDFKAGSMVVTGNRKGVAIANTGGDVTLHDSEIATNEVAVYALDAAHVTCQNVVMAHNAKGQLVVANTFGSDGTPSPDRRAPTDWTLKGNIIAADATCQAPLIDGNLGLALADVPKIPGFDAFFEGLTVDANLYYHAKGAQAFRGPDGTLLDLPAWKQLTGQDTRANFAAEALNQANLRLSADGVVLPGG